ncbi:hypothetical protein PsorP6_005132 [Peronosclerospora sorghi]|uniref:Uncharacterized protein n=1 Tax=Peronosclerospora sorghi TaxID=230839 RepID=A0ACC0W405_9STRA|nr:hypothetical protein PsorP6_005132 [Peronosclerospora sorghi]
MTHLVSKLYETSVNPFVMCTLELYLSLLLMVSLFHSPDPDLEDIRELQTTYHMGWVPVLSTVTLLHGAKLLGQYGPDPENFDRNLLKLKIAMWIYAFTELVVDKKMVVKSDPAFTNEDHETMFKHAVRDVILRQREQSMAATMQEFVDEAATRSSYENQNSIPIEHQESETTKYGTLAMYAI